MVTPHMSDTSPGNTRPPPDPGVQLDAARQQWRWFVAIGALQLVLGFIAASYVFTATLVSVIFIGTLMLIAGVGQLFHAWRLKSGSGFLLWTVGGVLYLAAGFFTFYNPLVGAALLTLVLGAILIGSGAFRLWVWFQHRSRPGWRWLALSGLISVLAGIAIAAGWPDNSVWVLGLLLSIDLLFQGWTLILLGMALHRRLNPVQR